MIMQWAAKEGYEIPKDFGLMVVDDISVLQYISPKLTTVSTNVEGVASTAVVELKMCIRDRATIIQTIQNVK